METGSVPSPAQSVTPKDELEALGLGFVQAYNARDLDAMLSLAHPEILGSPSRALGGGSYNGHAGMRGWWQILIQRNLWYEIVVSGIHRAERRVAERRTGTDAAAGAAGVWTPTRIEQRLAQRRQIGAHKLAMFGDICLDGVPLAPWATVIVVQEGRVVSLQSYLSSRSLLEEMGIVTEPIRLAHSAA